METINLKKDSFNTYLIKTESQNKALEVLAFFLAEECWSNIPQYIEWVKNVKKDRLSLGFTLHILFYENDTIAVIYDNDDEDEEYEKAIVEILKFVTTREHMIQIFTEWNRIINLEPQPEEVTLTYDGKRVGFIVNHS